MLIQRTHKVVLALLLSLSAIAVDICIPVTAVSIENLGGQPHQAHQIILMFLIGYGVFQIPAGILADRFGRRPILLGGLVVFTIAAVATAFTDNINSLLVWRFIQGVGGSVAPVLAKSIARDLTSGKELQRLFTTLTSALAFLTMLAPFLGSMLILIFEWRSVYFSTIFLGALAIVLVYFLIPETRPAEQGHNNIAQQFLLSMKSISQTPIAIWASVLAGLNFFGYLSLVSGFTIVARDVYALGSTASGAIFTGGVFIYFLASMVNRKFAQSHSPKTLIGVATIMYAISFVLFSIALLNRPAPIVLFCVMFIPYLVGFGFLFANCTSMSIDPLPQSAGFAAGILGTMQICIGSFGAFLTSALYDGSAKSLLLMMMIATLLLVVTFVAGNKWIVELSEN